MKKNELMITIIVLLTTIVGTTLCYAYSSPKDGIEKNGSTIESELQAGVDSLLSVKIKEIDGLQGQVIIMEVETGKTLAMSGLKKDKEEYQLATAPLIPSG